MATGLGRRSLLAVLVFVAACTGGDAEPQPSVSATSPRPERPGQPQKVQVDQARAWSADPRSWEVAIAWRPPAGAITADAYDVLRDGRRIADGITDTTVLDDEVEPGSRYRYAVIAISEDGQRSAPAVVRVTTRRPPIGDARLAGRFVLRLTPSSQYGLQGSVRGAPAQVTFAPTCDAGPCDVTWSVRGESGGGRLARDSSRYVGTGSSTFRIRPCTGGTQTESVTIDLRVTKAEVRRGSWRAVAVDGTLRESVPATGICVSAGITWAMTGTWIG